MLESVSEYSDGSQHRVYNYAMKNQHLSQIRSCLQLRGVKVEEIRICQDLRTKTPHRDLETCVTRRREIEVRNLAEQTIYGPGLWICRYNHMNTSRLRGRARGNVNLHCYLISQAMSREPEKEVNTIRMLCRVKSKDRRVTGVEHDLTRSYFSRLRRLGALSIMPDKYMSYFGRVSSMTCLVKTSS